MNDHTLAAIAFERWYALPQRDRTVERLLAFVDQYATSYYGQGPHNDAIGETISRAYTHARSKVRPWHLTPDAIDQLTRG